MKTRGLFLFRMPKSAPHPCRHPGCKALVRDGAFCEQHRKQAQKAYDDKRGSSSERGYNYRWQKARKTFLSRRPLCAKCAERGLITPASIVDHVIPHRGNQELFWDTSNWQSLCKPCHDSIKQAEERAAGRGG